MSRRYWPLLLLILLPLVWLLPARPVTLVGAGADQGPWPQIRLEPASPRPGEQVRIAVRDTEPWAYVLATLNGRPATWDGYERLADGTWQWRWNAVAPERLQVVRFFRDCNRGCIERGRLAWGIEGGTTAPGVPTKLCTVFPNPQRDWHERAGWGVELGYAALADDPFWGVDDLAVRVQEAQAAGLRLLLRVDFAQGQTLPPEGDAVALDLYLRYVARLARDERLRGVYGLIIGSGPNVSAEGVEPLSPDAYARLLVGFGEPPEGADNVVSVVRAANPQVRVLVGPVRPWATDRAGDGRFPDAPWLDYFDALVARLDEAASARIAAGRAPIVPDGFALHVPGRPEAAPDPSQEPRLSLPSEAWGGAELGFGIYRDWLARINTYPTTRGLPAYINSTNTFAPDGESPAQGYPSGWLTAALDVINREPQIQALCWFVDRDRSGSDQWALFSLSNPVGRMQDASMEFDQLLQR